MIRALGLALTLGGATSAAPATDVPVVGGDVATVDRYPPPAVSFPGGVRGLPGVVYWEPAGYRPLTLDLYLPPSLLEPPASGFPVVVYIHGGGWRGGDPRRGGPFVDFPRVLASVAAKGYVVASIEYRLSGEARFPAQAQDVKAAIRWLRLHALRYALDPCRIATWGVAAGGHLAALAAASCGAPGLEPAQPLAPETSADPITSARVSDCVQGAVAWYGVFDLATIAEQARTAHALSRDVPGAPEWLLLGCFGDGCTSRQLAAASPVTYVDRGTPPMLLVVGAEDTTVPHHQTLEMAERLKTAGVRHELLVLPGVAHGLVGKTPEQTRDANLEALEATLRFLDRTIGSGAGARD